MTDNPPRNKTTPEQAKELAEKLRDFVDRRGRSMSKLTRESLWTAVAHLENIANV